LARFVTTAILRVTSELERIGSEQRIRATYTVGVDVLSGTAVVKTSEITVVKGAESDLISKHRHQVRRTLSGITVK
jgi:hypothetical protein